MDKALALLTLASEAVTLARKLFAGTATEEDHRRVDDILPSGKSASELAAEAIERSRQ